MQPVSKTSCSLNEFGMVSVYMAKSGQENEKLRFANGDEFDGPTQYVDTLFQPEGNGKYRIAASGAIYSGTSVP